tara:strand:- start:155 stop:547 length:393 start_codon:yes stop_codon:yes gene_type:complete
MRDYSGLSPRCRAEENKIKIETTIEAIDPCFPYWEQLQNIDQKTKKLYRLIYTEGGLSPEHSDLSKRFDIGISDLNRYQASKDIFASLEQVKFQAQVLPITPNWKVRIIDVSEERPILMKDNKMKTWEIL